MDKRSYSEDDKAAALARLDLNDGNITKTAKELRVPATTLRQWRDGEHVNAGVAKKRDLKKQSLVELFEEIARAYAARALDATAIADTRGKDAVIAFATATDKIQLLEGKPTARTEAAAKVEHKIDEPSIDRLASIAGILLEVGAFTVADAGDPPNTETEPVYPTGTDAETGGVSAP